MGGVEYLNPEVQEALPQPDLLEAYSDREITVFGITGTFQDLTAMCPVDLSDPRITREAKNKFVVKAANEAGLEIEPEHETIFTRVIEEHGLERNFSVAPSREVTTQDPVLPKLTNPLTKVTENRAKVKELDNLQTNKWPQESSDEIRQDLLPREVLIPEIIEAMAHKRSKLQEVSIQVASLPEAKTRIDTLTKSEVVSEADIVNRDEPLISTTVISRDSQIFSEPKPNPINSALKPEVIVSQTFRNEIGAEQTAAHARYAVELTTDVSHEMLSDMISVWEYELAKDNPDFFDEFSEALIDYLKLDWLPAIDTEDLSSVPVHYETLESDHPMPTIVMQVAGQFELLRDDEKEQVTPQLKNIIGAVHGLLLLEKSGANPELIDLTQCQLEVLCTELFETLGVDYSNSDIKQFISVLLTPEFNKILKTIVHPFNIALTDEGTHEIKLLGINVGGNADTHSLLHQILGMFALFNNWSRLESGKLGRIPSGY